MRVCPAPTRPRYTSKSAPPFLSTSMKAPLGRRWRSARKHGPRRRSFAARDRECGRDKARAEGRFQDQLEDFWLQMEREFSLDVARESRSEVRAGRAILGAPGGEDKLLAIRCHR